jgi:outer membrane lipoprotein-sorting protein
MIHQLLTIYKKTFLLGLFLILLLPFLVNGQPEGYKAVADPDFVTKKINEASASTNTINTTFIQEKNLSFIEEKIISKGILFYEKPDKLRLEYKDPFTYIMIMNGGRMMTDNGEKKSEYDLTSNKMFSEINNLIISSVKGNILNNTNFKSSLFENNEIYFVQLIPLDKELGKYIKTIGLFMNKKDFTVDELQITEQSDDYTHIRFTNKAINEEIPPASFHMH